MIDTKELRRLVQAAISKMNARDPEFASSVTPLAVLELLDRLEAAESECLEQARLNGMGSEREAALLSKLEAAEKERDALRNEIACVKEVEFPRKAQAVADAWEGKCKRLEAERDALRAKITEMERQEPVGCVESLFDDVVIIHNDFDRAAPVYLAPGAQPQLNEIKIALQRALELGQREAWTGVRKHRSWEDQREEQQCWDKVWSLLGAKGE